MADVIRNCPKCGAEPDTYTEHVQAANEYNIDDGEIDRDGWQILGHIQKVSATCGECDYTWTLRGVTQVTDLYG